MSLVQEGFDAWRECRAEYDLVLYADYVRAEVSCYASDELLEHWETHPRTCYADFERQWTAAREAER